MPEVSSDKEHVAIFQVLDAVRSANNQRPVINRLAAHGCIQSGAKGIFAKDADTHGSAWIVERIFRPFDELEKVEKKNRFDLVFARWGLSGSRCADKGQQQNGCGEPRNERVGALLGISECMHGAQTCLNHSMGAG